jgi:hypothetical protein
MYRLGFWLVINGRISQIPSLTEAIDPTQLNPIRETSHQKQWEKFCRSTKLDFIHLSIRVLSTHVMILTSLELAILQI